MSIVTDALNRLQSDRSQKIAPPGSESSSPVISIFSRNQHKPVPTGSPIMRQVLLGLALIVVLGVIGLIAYLWGLTMVPPPPDFTLPPITEPVPVEVVPSPTSAEPAEPIDVPVEPLTQVPKSSATEDREGKRKKSSLLQSTEKPAVSKPAPIVPRKRRTPPLRSSSASRPTSSAPAKPLASQSERVDPTPILPSSLSPQREAVPEPRPPVRSGTTVLEKRLSLVKQLINRKRYGQAMTLLQPLFIESPKRWEPWFWRGTAHLGLGQLDQAGEAFVEGLARDSTIPHLWVQRALVSQQRGHFGEAVESLRQAELLAPELPEVQLNLGYSLEKRGDVGLAVDHYQQYLALTEGQPGYHSARKKVFNRIIQQRSGIRKP